MDVERVESRKCRGSDIHGESWQFTPAVQEEDSLLARFKLGGVDPSDIFAAWKQDHSFSVGCISLYDPINGDDSL